MTTERDPGTRIVLSWLREETHENAERVLLRALDEVDTTPQRRSWWPAWRTNRMNKLAMTAAAAATVLLVAVVGYNLLPGLGIVGPGATPAPSPSLLARGNFIEHDWGRVEFEANRVGSSTTGRMTVGEGRGSGWPITVELQCTRTTEDGLVLIGGVTTNAPSELSALYPVGSRAGIVLKRGPSVRANVWVGSLTNVTATQTTDCLTYLDAWLTFEQRTGPAGFEYPLRALDDEATVEFGP